MKVTMTTTGSLSVEATRDGFEFVATRPDGERIAASTDVASAGEALDGLLRWLAGEDVVA